MKITEVLKIFFLTTLFFVMLYSYDATKRMAFLQQENHKKMQLIEKICEREIIIADKTASNSAEKIALNESYEKFLLNPKDEKLKKTIYEQAYPILEEMKQFKKTDWQKNYSFKKEVDEYNIQIKDYNNFINLTPNFLLAKIYNYENVATIKTTNN